MALPDIRALRPMLATLAEHPLDDPAFVYEPKYDGIRALDRNRAAVGRRAAISIWSRLGQREDVAVPEIVRALERVRRGLRRRADPRRRDRRARRAGRAGRLSAAAGPHSPGVGARGASQDVAFIAFDILRDGDADLMDLPLTERRAHLEKRAVEAHRATRPPERGGGGRRAAMFERAKQQGWEGLIGKRADSCYRVGKRSPDWVKLKLVMTQEFVVGGWTEPRGARSAFGALLLGVYDGNGALEYVGHTGAGFDEKELRRVAALMKPLETPTSPFRVRPRPTSEHTGFDRSSWPRSSSPSGRRTASCGIRRISACATTWSRRASGGSRDARLAARAKRPGRAGAAVAPKRIREA